MDHRDGDWNIWSGGIRGRAAALCRMGEWRTKAAGRDDRIVGTRSGLRILANHTADPISVVGGSAADNASGDAVVTAPIESFSGSWSGRPIAIRSRPSPDPRDEIDADPELPSTTRSENDARIEPSIQESPSAWPLAHGHRCERRGECSAQAHQRPSPARRPCASADTTPPADTRRNSDCGAAPAPRRSGSRDFRTATRDRQGSGKRFGRRRR
jgi:hypothetical protein